MELSVVVLILTVSLTTVMCLISNVVTSMIYKRRKSVEVNMIRMKFCIKNARKIDAAMSNPNSPIRPDGQTYFEGILLEVQKEQDSRNPENSLNCISSTVNSTIMEATNE